MQLGVRARIERHLEQRSEDVVEQVLEVRDVAVRLVHFVQARHLDEPAHVGAEQAVVNDPARELVPLVGVPAIHRHAVLTHLVFALLEIANHLARDLGEVAPLDVVVRLEEDFAQLGLANRVVLEVEAVEAVERVLVRMHAQRVDAQVVRSQLERVKHVLQRHGRSTAAQHHVVGVPLDFRLDEAQ